MRRIWGGGGVGGLNVNDVLMKDARLSVPARGLAVHLLLLPNSAQPDLVRLASRPGESEDSIEGYLGELEEVGYLRRRLVYDRDGRAFEEVTVHARAGAADDAADIRGRVFHWPASPTREPRPAEADARSEAKEAEGRTEVEGRTDVEGPTAAEEATGIDEPAVSERRDEHAARDDSADDGDAPSESERESEREPERESEPVAAGAGAGRGLG